MQTNPANDYRRRWTHRWVLALATLSLAVAATAQQGNDGPVHLEADQAELDNVSGESVYTGDVRLTRGETVITGDRLELYTNESREIERAVVTGKPATYKGKPQANEGVVRAEAPHMTYYTGSNERLRLTKGAVLWRDQDRLKGQTVVYNVSEDTVQADSTEGDDNRVNITLKPDSDNKGE